VAGSVPAPSSSASDRRSARALALALVLAAVASGCTRGSTSPGDAAADDPSVAVVTDVVDGDTLTVELAGRRERVRLIGIDTPESVAPDRPVQCFGPEASLALTGLAPEGTRLRLVLDAETRDQYGRLLAYAYRADDELFLNRWLVAEGFAATMVFEPNTAHAAEFAALESAARTAGRGLWGACAGPDQPLD
jgi:micrococcal nuclease